MENFIELHFGFRLLITVLVSLWFFFWERGAHGLFYFIIDLYKDNDKKFGVSLDRDEIKYNKRKWADKLLHKYSYLMTGLFAFIPLTWFEESWYIYPFIWALILSIRWWFDLVLYWRAEWDKDTLGKDNFWDFLEVKYRPAVVILILVIIWVLKYII